MDASKCIVTIEPEMSGSCSGPTSRWLAHLIPYLVLNIAHTQNDKNMYIENVTPLHDQEVS